MQVQACLYRRRPRVLRLPYRLAFPRRHRHRLYRILKLHREIFRFRHLPQVLLRALLDLMAIMDIRNSGPRARRLHPMATHPTSSRINMEDTTSSDHHLLLLHMDIHISSSIPNSLMVAVHREGMEAILSIKGSSSRVEAGIRERIMETPQQVVTRKVPVASIGGRAMNSLLGRCLVGECIRPRITLLLTYL